MVSTLEQAQRIIEQQALQNQELVTQLTSAQRQIAMHQYQVEELLRRVYGRRSEKLHPDPPGREFTSLHRAGSGSKVRRTYFVSMQDSDDNPK